jgi:hypothetical protein
MDKPIHLSDTQLEQIVRAAAPLAPNDRSAFLTDVATALHGQALGDGAVFRAIREIQGAIFTRRNSPKAGSGNTGAEWPTGPLAVCSPTALRWPCIF